MAYLNQTKEKFKNNFKCNFFSQVFNLEYDYKYFGENLDYLMRQF